MVSSLIAALAALIAAVFAVAASQSPSTPEEPTPSAPPNQRSESGTLGSLRESIRDRAEAMTERIQAEALSQAEAPASSRTPDEPSPDTQSETFKDGCTTDAASGEGWSRSIVRCLQQPQGGSSSSVSVSSSSSVTVQETFADDVPSP